MELLLIRSYLPGGTNGSLNQGSRLICHTIELPWKDNIPRLSCIPEGRYGIQMRYSLRFKTHMMLTDVKDRSLILVHPANDALKELKGCIAPVMIHTGDGKGSGSRRAFEKLKLIISAAMGNEPVFLTIKT